MTAGRGQIDRSISSTYDKLTNVEKNIADFFLSNTEDFHFSSKNISSRLYVSEASLSRFAKKCGYKGFREFIYEYDREFHFAKQKNSLNEDIKQVADIYQELMDHNLWLVDEIQMKRLTGMLDHAGRIFVYGIGNSGYAAREFTLRFMRIGLYMEAVTDPDIMEMYASLATEQTLIIGVSLSGCTAELLQSLKTARSRRASVVLITANDDPALLDYGNEILLVANIKNKDLSVLISPQFPILSMMDLFFSYYLSEHTEKKRLLHTDGMSVCK